jgi:hypothetical protein
MQANLSPRNCLPFVLAVLSIVVIGCPHNDYTVQLRPHGRTIKRTLVFFRSDASNTNKGATNLPAFDATELAAIRALYPADGLTNDGGRYVVRGEFTNRMPDDVGGAGVYTNLTSSLGAAGFYVERFRGNDDLAGMTERRFQAAGRLTDLILGWSKAELRREPGYDKLHQFLDVDFRRDLKNLSSYWWEGELVNSYKTNASEEFTVRFAQYLFERGYLTISEIPGLIKDANHVPALLPRLQRFVARKMGVPDTEPVPASLAFLGDARQIEKSFTNHLADTEAYRAKLKHWADDKKLNPDAKQPEPSDLVGDAIKDLVDFELFGGQPDHLTVRLSLPSPPIHSNGRWDAAFNQVVWETDIMDRTNATRMPVSCYANWTQEDEQFQKAHLGKVAMTGDDLTEYCLWRSGQDAQQGEEWDAFLASLQPGTGLAEKIETFRFSGEVDSVVGNGQQIIPSSSAYPRDLLKRALK